FPLYGTVLAVFAQRLQGPGPAVSVLRGLLLGLFAFAWFFLVLALLLPNGIAFAFGSAIVAALAVQGTSLLAGLGLGLARTVRFERSTSSRTCARSPSCFVW